MLAYSYNPTTLEYVNSMELELDPIDNRYLMPKNTTTAPLPNLNQGEVAVYNRDRKKWDVILDHRGEWWSLDNGTAIEIKYIYDVSGVPNSQEMAMLAERILFNYEFKILTLANGERLVRESPHNHWTGLSYEYLDWDFYDQTFGLKKEIDKAVEGLKDKLKNNYSNQIKKNFIYKNKEFQTDEKSMNSMQFQILFSQDNEKVMWVCFDNTSIELSKYDLVDIIKGVKERNDKEFLKYQEAKQQLALCKDYTDIENLIPNWMAVISKNETPEIKMPTTSINEEK